MKGNMVLATKVPQMFIEEIESLIEQGKYLNKSDFLRAAARDKLEREKEDKE